MFGMMQRAAGAVISNGEWGISFFSQVPRYLGTGTISIKYNIRNLTAVPTGIIGTRMGHGMGTR